MPQDLRPFSYDFDSCRLLLHDCFMTLQYYFLECVYKQLIDMLKLLIITYYLTAGFCLLLKPNNFFVQNSTNKNSYVITHFLALRRGNCSLQIRAILLILRIWQYPVHVGWYLTYDLQAELLAPIKSFFLRLVCFVEFPSKLILQKDGCLLFKLEGLLVRYIIGR